MCNICIHVSNTVNMLQNRYNPTYYESGTFCIHILHIDSRIRLFKLISKEERVKTKKTSLLWTEVSYMLLRDRGIDQGLPHCVAKP